MSDSVVPEPVEVAQALLASADEATRLRGVHLLRDHRPVSKAATRLLVATLADPGSYVPHAARAALQDLGADALPAALSGLDDTDDAVRLGCVWVLARPQGERAGAVLKALATRVEHPSRDFRHAVASALGRIECGPRRTLQALEPLLTDRDARVRAEAVESLGLRPEVAREARVELLDALEDGNAQVRVAAASSLAHVEPDEEARERLEEALADEVDDAARLALASLRDTW